MSQDYNTHDAIKNIILCIGHINETLFSTLEALELLGQRIDLLSGQPPAKPKPRLSVVRSENDIL